MQRLASFPASAKKGGYILSFIHTKPTIKIFNITMKYYRTIEKIFLHDVLVTAKSYKTFFDFNRLYIAKEKFISEF